MADDDQGVVSVLTAQHRRLEKLLQTLVDAEMEEERRELLARAGDELAVHILAEEHVVYPQVRARATQDILLESLEEHLSLKRLLADLLALSPDDETFQAKCKVLEEQGRHHHKEEEEHLFPQMKQLLDAAAQAEMGRDVLAHERQLREAGSPRERVGEQTAAAAPL
ncbi:MAG: hemerythrin domain-containing protein [Rubrivivax sp.]|nr:MAG: hemerythrin domain-containing protein [Rubrivivax sp.]